MRYKQILLFIKMKSLNNQGNSPNSTRQVRCQTALKPRAHYGSTKSPKAYSSSSKASAIRTRNSRVSSNASRIFISPKSRPTTFPSASQTALFSPFSSSSTLATPTLTSQVVNDANILNFETISTFIYKNWFRLICLLFTLIITT